MSPDVLRLSVALVVQREQAQLEPFVASVLEQGGDDVEVVAVDDASPDHGPALLDALAARDPRVRVRHLAEPVGPGAARNVALDLVAGDAVWFAEPADRLAPGAVAAVRERLRATAADVLVVGHVRVDAVGDRRPDSGREALRRIARRRPGTLEQHPRLAATAPRLWDKVFGTAYLRALGVRFGSGAYGELTVTWPALLGAGRIAALPATSYERRAPGGGRTSRPAPGSPFDLFAQYDAVLAGVAPGRARELVLRVMGEQERAQLARMPESGRREWFRRMAEAERRHGGGVASRHGAGGAGGRHGAGGAGGRLAALRSALVARDDYLAHRGLEAGLDAWRGIRRGREAAARRQRSVVATARRADLRRHYRARLRRPLDPDLAVFAAYWYRGYACNPRAIYERAAELRPGLRGVWVVSRRHAGSMPAGVEHVVAGTPEYYDVIARASTFVNNVNFPDHLVKREGSVHVMTHHGTPLKRMGIDLKGTAARDGAVDFSALLRRCARWDYSVSQNAFSTVVWERVYPTRYESLEVGYPRNDVLARATGDDVARIRGELGIAPGRRAVLYAPTHRDHQPGHVGVVDLAAVADALGPDAVVLARRHHFDGAGAGLRRSGRVLDVTAHPSVEELMLAADVLVSDYSSVLFDYAVLDRPIVVHAPDWEVYRAVRGTYFDLLAEPPGVVTRTDAELAAAIASGAAWDAAAGDARAAFRARFCSLDDGHAAERVLRRAGLDRA